MSTGAGRRDRFLRGVTWRVTGGMAVAIGLLAVTVPGAFAHISISPSTAEAGSTVELTFRVPNEEASASTTRVSVLIPTSHPIAQLLPKPVAGWRIAVRTTHLAQPLVTDDGTFRSVVSQVTWSGGQILPGQYQDFSLSADPLPDAPTTLVFKALQGYSNGDVVRWIDVPQPGQPEPEHPAPVMTVTHAGASQSSLSASEMPAMADSGGASGSSDVTSGTAVAWVALGVSVVAVLVAAGSSVASRRRG
jgi:uncharacterized protein YcnI